jgi:hypothetical protein
VNGVDVPLYLQPGDEDELPVAVGVVLKTMTADFGPSPSERAMHWQRALNERWPARPRDLPQQPDPIEVRARVVWERDGEEWVQGKAVRWDQHHVLVQIHDPRCQTLGFWLPPADVRRAEGTNQGYNGRKGE